ncbi:MAG: FAD-binding protein [Candidatus Bipolaricaulota bacterium]|nr:FAD-binding protein [Candidatus Bipolaricaulota bacterium]
MAGLASELRALLSPHAKIYEDLSSRRLYARDQGEPPRFVEKLLLKSNIPDLVLQPALPDDVSAALRWALARELAVVPRGAATFGLGGAVPTQHGLVLDFSALRQIEEINPDEQTVTVLAGTRWADVAHAITPYELALCTYPTSWFSTVGGWVNTGGYGVGSIAYGHFKNQIQRLTVITPQGDLKELDSDDPEFEYFIGTEGQMGVVWAVTLRLRRAPPKTTPVLLQCDSAENAFALARELLQAGFQPYHMKYLSTTRLREINELLHSSTAKIPERQSLLIAFDDPESARACKRWAEQNEIAVGSPYQAYYLWHERLFPMRPKRLGPGMLAAEVVLSAAKAPEFIRKAEREGARYGVHLASEAYCVDDGQVLLLPVFTFDAHNKLSEFFIASLSLVLTKLGIALGGRPYVIGIWNAPFARAKFGERFDELRAYKRKIDPDGLFNPGKFFALPAHWSSMMLRGLPVSVGLEAARLIAPLARQFFDPTPKRYLAREPGRPPTAISPLLDLLEYNETLCSRCGSCVPVCPAYIYTKDERTTARGKLQLGLALLKGEELDAAGAQALFYCMHCRACTDVCQSSLDLVPVWDELERRVEQRYGKDSQKIEEFVRGVEAMEIMPGTEYVPPIKAPITSPSPVATYGRGRGVLVQHLFSESSRQARVRATKGVADGDRHAQ